MHLQLPLLALTTFASATLASTSPLLRADDVLIRPYVTLPHLARRQANTNFTTDISLDDDNTVDLTTWDETTNAACLSALARLPRSSNPSGTCICYNLPSLDMQTGVFEADLRLFKVSEPRGSWAEIAPENIMVGLKYNGATVSELRPGDMANNTSDVSKRAEEDIQLLKTYMFVGRIDALRMQQNMPMAAVEALVIPILTLTARNSTGGTVTTNVSTNEAAFLQGVFSSEVVMSDFSAAQAAVDEQIEGLKNGTVAFVLPGVQLMIFPVGLIITSVWLLIGVAVYGFGTYERMMYADAYRRRQSFEVRRGKTF